MELEEVLQEGCPSSATGGHRRKQDRKASHLEPLAHLELVAVWEVLHEPAELHVVTLGLLQQPVGDLVRPVLSGGRDLARVRTGDLDRRDRLSDDKEVLNLADEVARRAVDGDATRSGCNIQDQPVVLLNKNGRQAPGGSPDTEEVGLGRLVLEERGLDHVVVQRLLGRALVDRRKGRVRGLILRVEHKRLAEFKLPGMSRNRDDQPLDVG
jgi:hypothetical protein